MTQLSNDLVERAIVLPSDGTLDIFNEEYYFGGIVNEGFRSTTELDSTNRPSE